MQGIQPKKKLRKKIIILLVSLFLVNLLAITFIFNAFFIDKIDRISYENGKDQTEKFENAMDFSLDYLKNTTEDWAAWTPTYNFIANNDNFYIEENFNLQIYQSLGLHLAMIVNENNQIIFSEQTNTTYTEKQEIPKPLLDKLEKITGQHNLGQKSGMITDGRHILLFAMHPVLKNDYTGPPNGFFIFGKYIDQRAVAGYEELFGTDFELIYAKDDPELLHNLQGQNDFFQRFEESSMQLQNYALLNDYFDDPAAIVVSPSSFLVTQLAKDSIQFFFIITLALMITTLAIFLIFFENNVNKRLILLSDEIHEIGKGDFRKRVTSLKKPDEISFVTDRLNIMLDNLEGMKNILIDNEEKSYLLAYHDQLTGLPNRINFTEELELRLLYAQEHAKKVAVVFLDLDHFKLVNDALGHNKGDELLIQLSNRLSSVEDPEMFLARVSGDEFLLCFSGMQNEKQMNKRVLLLLECFRKPFLIDQQEIFISASIGVSLYPEDGTEADVLIKNADVAMYKAKEEGKNKLEYVTNDLKEDVFEKMKITNALFKALEKNEFLLHYQPQFDTEQNKIIGLEALLRWNSAELGFVEPSKFIPIAEQTHLIMIIGDWVLEQACKDLKKINATISDNIFMAVNLSLKQFQNQGLARQIERILKDTDTDPVLLDLEITESVSMVNTDYMHQLFNDLKKIGVTLALDDFGTEYSSLSHIKQLPLDKIKIAMPFIQSIGKNKKDEAIIRTIITLCRNLGISVLAEGVETKEQLEFLKKEDCKLIQGYYLSKPLPFKEVKNLVLELNEKK